MCGLAMCSFKSGAVSEAKRGALMSVLASFNSERGNHSWGVCGLIEGEDEVLITRGLGDISDHIGEVVEYNHMFLHTRWGTQGARTIENAHPFEVQDIIGAHNGCVYNHHALNAKYDRDFDCDSPHIFQHMAEGRSLETIEGYGSIMWVNKLRQDTIYACRMRNGELSIYAIGTKDNVVGIVASSDEKHLIKALQVCGFKDYFAYKVTEGCVYAVTDGAVYLTTQEMNLGASQLSYKWSDIKDDMNEYSSEAYWERMWNRAEDGEFEERDEKQTAADKQFRKRMASERRSLAAGGVDYTDPAWEDYVKQWDIINNPDKDDDSDENSLDYIGRYSG